MNKTNGITEGVIWKQLLIFFFPILLGTFFQQMYNTVDTLIVGRFVGKEALAGVGTTGTLINLLFGFFIGLASGATVIISQFYGARNEKDLSRAVHTALALSLTGGLVLSVVGFLIARPALKLLQVAEKAVLDNAVTYMRIFFAGILASVIYNVGTGILRGIGDSRFPLYVLIVSCVANILLDLLFVVVFRMEVVGVALATVLSQLISAVLVMLRLMRTREAYQVRLREIRFHKGFLKKIVRIGLPSGLQSVLYSISNLVLQGAVNSFGTDATAAYAAAGRIDGFIWMVLGAFGISITTFSGQNFGARKFDRVKRGNTVCLMMCASAILALSAVLFFFARPLVRLFTEDGAVTDIAVTFLRIWAPAYICFAFIETLAGTVRGAGEALQPTLITLLGVCVARLIWIFVVLPFFPEIRTLALCYPVTWLITMTAFLIYYYRMRWLKRCTRGIPAEESI